MNWTKDCAYCGAQKARFHTAARARLRQLAAVLGLVPGSYELRSNKAGIAVSGEITLHHDRVYVHVSQSSLGPSAGILIRTCRSRRDYSGGHNNFAPLALLDDVPAGRARALRRARPLLARGGVRGKGRRCAS